ncbi:DUF4931 domain-containing protein [Myxococcota bacterium]|nr:DUF4931 domain-containing protein [Myxococcota bacterium]
MPELRHDPIQKRWVIIATERSRRPSDLHVGSSAVGDAGAFCPFCPGNESATPPEIMAIRPPGSHAGAPDWKVRVVPNKFPALRIEGSPDREAAGVYDRMNGIGAHEVIVETPEHGTSLADMDYRGVERVVQAYVARQADLLRDQRFKYVLVFKNHGEVAGATLSHPHSQVIATPVTPRTISTELTSAREHYHLKERCLFCDVLAQELQAGARVVWSDPMFAVIAPYASRFPFELMILPRRHGHAITALTPEEVSGLARVLRDTLRRLKIALGDPAYNFMIHTAPNLDYEPRRVTFWQTIPWDFHWHIEIIPRLTQVAGFEWGTGFYINPTAPEEAAMFLRGIELR